MSTKVAELDQVVPLQLGVSPAILESVIFCHQDESLWPMSEPSKLKVKFDEIFEAQKYTKAIDVIVKLRKTHQGNLNGLVIHEANFKENKDKAERVQKKMVDLEGEIEILRTEETSLKQQMKECLELSRIATEKKNEALMIVNELLSKESQAEGLAHTLDTLSTTLQESSDSDYELQSKLDHSEEMLQQYKDQENTYRARWAELHAAETNLRQEMSSKQAELGQYNAEKLSYERSISSRVQLVREAARSHSLRGYDGDLDEEQVREFVRRMNKLSQEKDRELDRINIATADESKQSNARISELENRQATRISQKVQAIEITKDNEKKIRMRQAEINSIRMDEGAKAALDDKFHNVHRLLTTANSNFEAAGWDNKRKIEVARQHELHTESKELKAELFQSNNLANERAQLEHTKKLAKESQQSLNTLVNVHRPALDKLLGSGWDPKNLDREFQAVLDRKTSIVSDAKRKKDGAEKDLEKTIFKLDTARSTLKSGTEEMKKCESAVLNSIIDMDDKPLTTVDDYLGELEKLDTETTKLRKQVDDIKFYSAYFQKCLDTIEEKNCCRLCERTFAGHEKIKTTKKLEKMLSDSAEAKQLFEDLESYEAELKTGNQARSQYDNFKKLQVEVTKLEAELKKLEREKATRDAECEYEDGLLREAETSKRDIEILSNEVHKITNYSDELERHDRDITRLSSQQNLTGTTKSIEEMQEQMAACDEQLRTIQAKIDKISADREHARSEISKLEIQETNLRSEIASAGSMLEKKQSLTAAIEELRESDVRQKEVERLADQDLKIIEPQLAQARAQDEDIKQRGQLKAKDVQTDKSKLAQTVNQLKLAGDAIEEYLDAGGPAKLAACERAIKACKQEQEGVEKEMKQVTNKNKDVERKIAESGTMKSSILENLRYRNVTKQLDIVKREIAELKTRNANEEYNKYNRHAQKADLRYQKFLTERGTVVGAMKSKDNELIEKMAEWDTDYRNAAQQYRETHVKVETTKAAIEDMAKCKIALDHAIMKYHSIKMEEINSIASELWRSTYQGTDVDNIMIRSESESPTANKNYNYRVVMVKQDTEMDMRGRCSAGQRVLASIIIRLALAECFGVNCGVSLLLLIILDVYANLSGHCPR